MNIDGLSLRSLVAELDRRLAGARIDKISQPDKFRLGVWLRQPGENIALLLSASPESAGAWLPSALPENPAVPPAFCMLLRKHLEDGRIASVAQHGLDRVVAIAVDTRGEGGLIVTKQLILEIMGKHSNIILVQDGLVLDAIRRVGASISRVRHILPGRPYLLPPGQPRADILATEPAAFVAALRREHGTLGLAKAIVAAAEGVGPVTAREIAWRAGLPADHPVAALDGADAAALDEAIASIAAPLAAGETQPTVALSADGGKLLALAAFRPEHLAGDFRPFPTMAAAVEYAANFQGQPANPEKTVLQKLLVQETARLARKEAILAAELAAADEADKYRVYGDLLMANLHTVPAGAAQVILPNLYDEAAAPLAIPLDPLLSPVANAKRHYVKYNKAKRAQQSLAAQLAECRADLAYLDSVAVSLDQAAVLDEISEVRQELVQGGYIKEKSKRRPAPPAAPLAAAAPDGTPILIGRNNRQNDLVTFKHAGPDDLWLHTKDIPGSHVILKTAGREPAPEALAAAAMLAAYYSKARASATVPVDYTRRRHVKKPSGAKPGFVIYDRQKTLYVTPDEQAVKQMLVNKKG
ncbi:NFACT family protein [Anaeroselena agilis]|uniref:Rqc2 homolog RqcH n=1 Tax=Anaeroselena agilis TaxID=3063788 RepID=A0ABU3NXJ2_9FIRM|nr:NFACT RNA binding domain-containing protein [Selenomonadales bacterium 4137-cl]